MGRPGKRALQRIAAPPLRITQPFPMAFEYTLDGRNLLTAIPDHEDRIASRRMGRTRSLLGYWNPFGFTSLFVDRLAAPVLKSKARGVAAARVLRCHRQTRCVLIHDLPPPADFCPRNARARCIRHRLTFLVGQIEH